MTALLLALLLDVSGYVYTVDGDAVAGATVRAGAATTTTNKDGAFALTNLPEGVVELEIAAKGLPTARPLVLAGDVVSVTLVEVGEQAVPRSNARGEATVSGKVTVDGKPLANAPVIVGETRVVTNAKGEYVAKGLPATKPTVTVDERLYPRLRFPRVETSGDIELRSAPMIRGTVVDAEGKPVSRARVQLVPANRSTLDFAFDLTAPRTTPEGRFAVPAPDWVGNEQVSVAVTPLLHSTVRTKPFLLGDADRTVDVTLPKLETVRIRVLDRAGKPVPEARVGYGSTADTATFESPTFLVDYGREQRVPKANAEGELVVQLAADTYDFAAAAEGFQIGTVTKAITKPATVDITLERAAPLRGRVHRGDRGVEGVSVNLVGGRSRNANVTTDKDGKFTMNGLAPDTYRLVFFKEGELIDRTMDVEAPGNVDLALPLTGKLRGRVIDAETREAVTEFRFSVESTQPGTSGIHRGQSSSDGTFTVEIPAGTYRVSAGAKNFVSSEPAEVRVVENETATVDVPLSRGVTITGRVTDESGLPVAGAMVLVTTADPVRVRQGARVGPLQPVTADDGTFTVRGVEPGEVQLTVRKQGYVLYQKPVEAAGTMSLDVTLTRGLSIHGVVTRGGKPVAGAQVGAASAAVGGEHQAATSDEDGRFTLAGLIAARYTVSAFLEDQHTEVRDVDPARQKDLVLALDAKTRGVIHGIVTGIPPAAGKYVRRVVMVYSEDDGEEGLIDDAGNYRIENAPLGSVWVSAFVESAARSTLSSARKQVEVTAAQPVRADLEIAGSVRVSGRVTVDGKPGEAYVAFSSEDGMMAGAQTRDDGSYEIALAGPGRFQIYAQAEQFQERNFQTIRDIRGGETIDIDLREQVVEGTVVDAVTRLPIADALVTLAPAAMASIVAEVPTDANGRFRLVTAAAGALRVIASAHGYAQRVMPVSGSSTQYAFELSPVPELRIRVLDARNGAPLDAHVVFRDDGGILPVRPRRTADGITYVFSVAPGKYQVMAIVQGYATKTIEVTAPGAADILME